MLPQLEQLSHATIITGNRAANFSYVQDYLKQQGIATEANPDIFILNDESLGVDIVRDEIIPFISSKKVSAARFAIISFDRATAEAQNTLLKSIEEPQPGTHFIVLVPRADTLLPTILSRVQLVIGDQAAGESRMDAGEFLKSTMAKRFTLVEEWTKNKKDEDNLSKTEVVNFLDQIEKILWQEACRDEQLFADIRQMRQYANIRGASHRVILDFVAMIAPVLKK